MPDIPSTQAKPTIICFSHLRWEFVWQRPQQLLSRAARDYNVVFVEEAIRAAVDEPVLKRLSPALSVTVLQLHVPLELPQDQVEGLLRLAIETTLAHRARPFVLWFYTPMALPLAVNLPASFAVYDCMDDLASFRGAAPDMRQREDELLKRVGLVITGGRSLFASRKDRHPHVRLFPSSVDTEHFGAARAAGADPGDQAPIATPRIGYFGVIDERLDMALIEGLATAEPNWHLVMLGPTVKIDPSTMPKRANIHWLGAKPYGQLPDYLRNWSAGFMPFALNEATRYISPTKTPEYLAAGLPLVSTPVPDVVSDYGDLVRFARDVPSFAATLQSAIGEYRVGWLAKVDTRLRLQSWDATWADIAALLSKGVSAGGEAAAELPFHV